MGASCPALTEKEIQHFMEYSKNEKDDSQRCSQIIGQIIGQLRGQIKKQATEIIRLHKFTDENARLSQQFKDDTETISELQADLDKLKQFARHVIRTECWSIEDMDGLEIQDLAEKLGLIEAHTVTEEDADDDFGVGDTRYKFSEFMKG